MKDTQGKHKKYSAASFLPETYKHKVKKYTNTPLFFFYVEDVTPLWFFF